MIEKDSVMAFDPSDFLVTLTPAPINIVLGMTGNLQMTFSNISTSDYIYNLSVKVVLPDGVSFGSSAIPPTSITNNPSGTITVDWVDLTDLAPNQLNYTINFTVQSDTIYRATGKPVQIDTSLGLITGSGTIDTSPQGPIDPNNHQYTNSQNSEVKATRYNIVKSESGKMPKGAGLINPVTVERWPFTYTLVVENNVDVDSTVSVIDMLPNGVRYLGMVSVVGPNPALFLNPTVTYPSGAINNTTIDWGSVILTANSIYTIKFKVAIWDKYTTGGIENSGAIIPHGTALQNTVTLDGASGPVTSNVTTLAMDATINKVVTPSTVDIGTVVHYTLDYEVNQYEMVNNFVITDTLSDGQSYNIGSASVPPTVTINPNGTTTLVWSLGNLATGTAASITFTATVNSTYHDGSPVVASDTLSNIVSCNGTNATTSQGTPDSSSTTIDIMTPSITKTLLGYYYADGTAKPVTVTAAAPGDLVEFRIVYSSIGLLADQRYVFIDEYAPFNMGPLTASLPVVYGGDIPSGAPPIVVSPNGLRWTLGTVSGGRTWSATFKIPVSTTEYVGQSVGYNLAKYAGYSSENLAYSGRSQATVNFGTPNIQFTKTIDPTTNPVIAGDTYTYTVTIANPQLASGLVTEAYHMPFTDTIPAGMTIDGVPQVSGTGIYSNLTYTASSISLMVVYLGINDSLIVTYKVKVAKPIPAGIKLDNNATLGEPYAQPDLTYQYPGNGYKAVVNRNSANIPITKSASDTTPLVGDQITYTITFTVPEGTIAYTPTFQDTLPTNQTFDAATVKVGSGTQDPVTPLPIGQQLNFPPLATIDATASAVTVVYTINVWISAKHISPYQETQINSATVSWAIAQGGSLVNSSNTTTTVTVNMPNLEIVKQQKNVTTGGTYTTGHIIANVGDIISYQITVTNNGTATAENIHLRDNINENATFNSIITYPTSGIVTTHFTLPGAYFTWDNFTLASLASDFLEYTVTVKDDEGVANLMNGTYDSNTVNPTTYPVTSNQVGASTNIVQLEKQVYPTTANIGDTINYTLTLTVPTGMDVFNAIVSDTLPTGQQYAGNAKRNYYTVKPDVSGDVVTFPKETIIDPEATDVIVVYTFSATVVSAQTYPESQVDLATVNWEVTPTGPSGPVENANATVTVNQAPAYRGISIEDAALAQQILLGEWE